MTRSGRRLIDDFLLPALNDGRYGNLLQWMDKEKGIFSIKWHHKNAAKWSLEDTIVFQDWDKLKGHYRPESPHYYMQAKQRFRAALYKLNRVSKLKCEQKHVKLYMLKSKDEESAGRSKLAKNQRKNDSRKCIPTPVICENPQNAVISEPEPENDSSNELQKVFFEYTRSQKKMMRTRNPMDERNGGTSPINEINSAGHQRVSHIPIQPPPMYNHNFTAFDANQRRYDDTYPMRYESPAMILVKTYQEEREETDDELEVGCVLFEEEHDENEEGYKNALNLCMKSNGSSR